MRLRPIQITPSEEALHLAMEGIVTGDASDDLLHIVTLLLSAVGQIRAPSGLTARRGRILAVAVPTAAGSTIQRGTRRARFAAMAAAVAAGTMVGVLGANAGTSWLRDLASRPGVLEAGSPVEEASGSAVTMNPTPSLTPSPSPSVPGETDESLDDDSPGEPEEPGETDDTEQDESSSPND